MIRFIETDGMCLDVEIMHRIAEARVAGSTDVNELRTARKTVQTLLSELFDSQHGTNRNLGE